MNPQEYKVRIQKRRTGKTTDAINLLVTSALRKGTYVYISGIGSEPLRRLIFPRFAQELDDRKLKYKSSKVNLCYTLENGSIIKLLPYVNHADYMLGIRVDGLVMDEIFEQRNSYKNGKTVRKTKAYSKKLDRLKFLCGSLVAFGGFVLIIGTPHDKRSILYDL